MLTFRLVDALPSLVLAELRAGSHHLLDARFRRRCEDALDIGHGACYLRNEGIARLMEQALLHFDGLRYRSLAWMVMPNHVHALIAMTSADPVAAVVHSWKSFTAKEANRLLGRRGEFWQADYLDRVMRNEAHLRSAIEYIHSNPCRAGLVSNEQDWPFSSAARSDWAARGAQSVFPAEKVEIPEGDINTGAGGTPALRP